MDKLRKLRCVRCDGEWEEPVRGGQRPWYCPGCEPGLAERRRKQRAQNRGDSLPAPDSIVVDQTVPRWLQTTVASAVNAAHIWDAPSISDVSEQFIALRAAMQLGTEATRDALTKLGGCALSMAATLPDQEAERQAA